MNQNNMPCAGPMKNVDRDKQCVLNRPQMMENMNPSNFPGVSQLTLTGTKVPTENLTPQQRQHREEQLATLRKMQQILFPENQTQQTDEFGNPRLVPPGNVNVNMNVNANAGQNADDPNRNSNLDVNDIKNQIGLKNINSNSNNMNRPLGRNVNGQPTTNVPMESPMGHGMGNPPGNVLDGPEGMEAMQEQNPHMMQVGRA